MPKQCSSPLFADRDHRALVQALSDSEKDRNGQIRLINLRATIEGVEPPQIRLTENENYLLTRVWQPNQQIAARRSPMLRRYLERARVASSDRRKQRSAYATEFIHDVFISYIHNW